MNYYLIFNSLGKQVLTKEELDKKLQAKRLNEGDEIIEVSEVARYRVGESKQVLIK